MTRDSLDRRAEALSEKMGDQLGARGRSFESRAAHAGRQIPKSVRRDVDLILDARQRAGHPKLSRQVDQARVDAAIDKTSNWLDTIDRPARRRAAALDLLANVAFRILVVAILVLGVLIWRDLI